MHSTLVGHLDYLQFLAMMNNNAAMTTHKFLYGHVFFNYLGCIPRSKIPESFIIHF